MDNNNFEQQFTQNVKSAMPAKPVANTGDGSSRLPLVVAIVLGVITLVETVILAVTLVNFFQVVNPAEEEAIESDYEPFSGEDESTGYNDDDELVWLNVTCTNKDSDSKYVFTKSKSYQLYNGSNLVNSGSYTIVNDSLVSLSGNEGKVLFYDGWSIADGLTIYDCDFEVEETTEAE